jgi:Class III cytochrome C family
MHKYYLLMVGVVIVAIFSFGLVIADESEDNMCIPMGTIVIEPPDGVEPKRAAVDFPHATHFNYTCNTCHHTWDRETPVLSCMTANCHDLATSPKKSDGQKMDPERAIRYYKSAYHSACIGCHKKINQENKAIEKSYRVTASIQSSGPTGCAECHPKE